MTSGVALLRLARPHFLLGGVLLFALGAFAAETIDPAGYAIGQVMVSAVQLTAHLANEYADAEADRHVGNRTWFSGGSGAIPDGLLERRAARHAALGSSAVAILATAAMSTRSVEAAVIGAGALAAAWLYSVEPLRLLGTGFGELITSLVVAAGVPVVGTLSQGVTAIPSALWWAVAALVPIHLAMMLCFELPDFESDRRAGKRVLAVRIGREWTSRLLLGLGITTGLIVTVGYLADALTRRSLLSVLAIVPAVAAIASLRARRYGLLTASAVATLTVVALGLLLGSI